MKVPVKIQIWYLKIERAVTRPVRKLAFRRVWRRNCPVAMITGSHGKTTTSRLLANVLTEAGHTVGLSSTDGVFIDGKPEKIGDLAGYYGARRVLRNKRVTAAVLETAIGGLMKRGTFLPSCNAGALLNVLSEHLRIAGLTSLDQIFEIKRVVPDIAQDAHVLNAQDERCMALARNYDPRKVIAFSMDPDCPALAGILERGGRGITLSSDRRWILSLAPDAAPEKIVEVALVVATCGGIVDYNTANALAVCALALGLGVDTDAIRRGLTTTTPRFGTLPRRFEIVTDFPFQVVYDRVNGPAGFAASVAAQQNIPVAGKRYGMLTLPGNMADATHAEMAAAAAGSFDAYVCFENDSLRRGREHGELASRYADALMACGVDAAEILQASSEEEGFDLIAPCLKPGDLLFIQR